MTDSESGHSEAPLGRVLGVDLGTVRVGLALSDSRRTIASPYGVFRRSGTLEDDHKKIREIVAQQAVALVVVGLPLSLSGDESRSSTAARGEVEQLQTCIGVPVQLVDERLSSVEALARRRQVTDLSNAARRGGRGGRARKSLKRGEPKGPVVVDDRAAAIILQSFLDRHQPSAKGGLDD